MPQKPMSLGISINMLIFLTYCVSSDSFSFRHRILNFLAPGHAEPGCFSYPLNSRCVLSSREEILRECAPSSFRALGKISSAKLFRMSGSNCHPDDDPSSGSVLPVKDRIALYSQVLRLSDLCCNNLRSKFSCSIHESCSAI
jgi:hypothetical protein